MLSEAEKEFIGRIDEMRNLNVSTAHTTVMPQLHKDVFGRMYRTDCGNCVQEAYNQLVKWANKRLQKINIMAQGKYRFKVEHKLKTFPFWHKGMKYIINQHNLTDATAEILLQVPKYAHAIERNPDFKHEIITDVLADKPVQHIAASEVNGSEVSDEGKQSADATASTSNEQKTGGEDAKNKRGRPSKK